MPYNSIYRRDRFRDHIVVITGGGSGIGRCTAHELASLGAHVAVVGRNEAELERVRGEIESDGGSNTARLEYVQSTTRRGTCSGQAKLGQQRADIPVGVY
jgi:NADP-dependent 3-hydroxy acid dehydrogenase YdfG